MFSEVFQMDKILGFCEKLWYVIGANLLFLLSNLPALLFFLFVGAHLPAILPAVHGSCGAGALRPVLHHEPPALQNGDRGMERLQEGIQG